MGLLFDHKLKSIVTTLISTWFIHFNARRSSSIFTAKDLSSGKDNPTKSNRDPRLGLKADLKAHLRWQSRNSISQ
jgi:hypothetical protein